MLSLCLLTGCGGAADTSGLAGVYILSSAEERGILISAEKVEELGTVLSLYENGRGTISDRDGSGRLRWRFEDDRIFLQVGSTHFTGNLDGQQIVLHNTDSDTVFVFQSAMFPEETPVYEDRYFEGDWYGWWRIEESEGTMPETWYDCCARFSLNPNGTVQMLFWDENGSCSEPLAEVCFAVQEDGTLLSLRGYFLYAGIRAGEWHLSLPDPVLRATDFEHDAEGEHFRFSFCLRPWGQHWDTNIDMQPFYYEDWVLPLLDAGKSMPEEIPWQQLEEQRES